MMRIGRQAEQHRDLLDRIERLVLPVVEDCGCELVDVQFRRESHGWVLRLYIDRPDGVTVDDCASVSREIAVLLEVDDPIAHAYHLEVSSPGLDRPLTRKEDFDRFQGRKVRIRLNRRLAERRVFTGVLKGLVNDQVHLLVEGTPVVLDIDMIARARLVPEFGGN